MRENCTYGSEGGEVRRGLPYPYLAAFLWSVAASRCFE